MSDAVLEDYLSLCDHLASDARIAHDPLFELGILKIQEGHEALLNVIEKQEVSGLPVRTREIGEDIKDASSIVK